MTTASKWLPRRSSSPGADCWPPRRRAGGGGHRARSTRAVINYAELTTVAPRMHEIISKVLDDRDPSAPSARTSSRSPAA